MNIVTVDEPDRNPNPIEMGQFYLLPMKSYRDGTDRLLIIARTGTDEFYAIHCASGDRRYDASRTLYSISRSLAEDEAVRVLTTIRIDPQQ